MKSGEGQISFWPWHLGRRNTRCQLFHQFSEAMSGMSETIYIRQIFHRKDGTLVNSRKPINLLPFLNSLVINLRQFLV